MKNILLAMAFLVALVSCSKDSNDSTPNNPDLITPSLRFTANGKAYEWNYSYQQTANKGVGLVQGTSGQYSLMAMSDGEYLNLGLPTNILLEKSYTYNQGSSTTNGFTEVKLDAIDLNNAYKAANTGDFVTVEVYQINGDKASGTFRAQLSVAGDESKKLQITNGVFANIKVVD